LKYIKSERLKKFEIELSDLEQWLRLGLVPKKDVEKHKQDIQTLIQKIANEKERLESSKNNESVSTEHFAPKQSNKPKSYEEVILLDNEESVENLPCSEFDLNEEGSEVENSIFKEIDAERNFSTEPEADDELDFSDKSRCGRLKNVDPDNEYW